MPEQYPSSLDQTPVPDLLSQEQPTSVPPSTPLPPPPKKAKPLSIEEAYDRGQQMLSQRDPYFGSGFYQPMITPERQARKYLDQDYGFMPGIDMEDFYAQRQGFFSNLGNGLGNLVTGFIAKTGAGLGYLGAMANPFNMMDPDGYFSAVADNAFSKAFDEFEKYSKEELFPVFQEADQRNQGFWKRATTDMNFWTEDFFDGLAFLASAYVPGGVMAKIGTGMKMAQGLSKLGIGLGKAAQTVEGLETVSNYLRGAATMSKTFDKATTWAVATASEAMVESKELKDKLLKEYENKINPNTGTFFTRQEINQIANSSLRDNFLMNAALLGATNFFELNYFYKILGKSEGVVGKLNRPALGQAFEALPEATGKLGKFFQSNKGQFLIGGGMGILREGFVEENMQLAISRFNEENNKMGKMMGLTDYFDVFGKFIKQTGDALAGRDPEASISIGLGALLGGAPGGIGQVSQNIKDRLTTEKAVEMLNASQANWLKFGNIYKTETIETPNENGEVVKEQRVKLDAEGKPELDTEKMATTMSGYMTNVQMIDQSNKESVRLRQQMYRDSSFGSFVVAHINAGIEDVLMDKLDQIKTFKPEELMALGFDPKSDMATEVDTYKAFAQDIIRRNKLIEEDIFFKGKNPSVDQARKDALLNLTIQQSVYKKMNQQLDNELIELRNGFVNDNNSSLTDSMVDQLNDLQSRIESQQYYIERLKEGKFERPVQMEVAENLLKELDKQKQELLKNNELTVAKLKKKGDYYLYDKGERNDETFAKMHEKKFRTKGQVQNMIRMAGLEFAKYADAIDGEKNFLRFVDSELVKPVNDMQDAAEKEETKTKSSEVEAEGPRTLKVNIKGEGENPDIEFEIAEGDLFEFDNPETKKTEKVNIVRFTDNDQSVVFTTDEEKKELTYSLQDLVKLFIAQGWKRTPRKPKQPSNTTAESTGNTEEGDEGVDNDRTDEDSDKPYSRELKPKFEDVGFNKIFGQHYIDRGSDQVENKENGTARFYRFTSKYNLAGRDYVLKVVTEGNDDFKIRSTDPRYPEDIKVILMKRIRYSNGDVGYQYVDENNELIPEGEETADKLIYRSLAHISTWTVDMVKNSYTVAKTTKPEDIQKVIDEHKVFQQSLRERIAAGEDVYLDVIKTSPGVQRVEYTTAVGENGRPLPAMNDMEGRVIQPNPDYNDLRSIINPENSIELVVTTGDGIFKGVPKGRMVMSEYTMIDGKKIRGDKFFRVYSRKLEQEEKDTVIQALARLSELYGKKYTLDYQSRKQRTKPLSAEEEAEMDLLHNYLEAVINFNRPSPGKSKEKNIWVDNGLHFGDKVIKFNRADILNNAEAILANAYHNVNKKKLTENKKFIGVKFNKLGKALADENNTYNTYQEYLIAKRKDGKVAPVYTSLPLYDEGNPQRTSAYIVWKDPSVEHGVKPLARVQESKTDKDIEKFLSGAKKKIEVNGVKISLVETEDKDTKTTVYNIKVVGNGLDKLSKDYPSLEKFKSESEEIIKMILQVTGYVYKGNKGLWALAERAVEEKNRKERTKTQEKKTVQDVSRGLVKIGDKIKLNNVEVEGQFGDIRVTGEYTVFDMIKKGQTYQVGNETKTIQEDMYALRDGMGMEFAISASQVAAALAEQTEEEEAPPTSSETVFHTSIAAAVKAAVPANGKLSAKVYQKDKATGALVMENGEPVLLAEATVDYNGNLLVAQNKLTKALGKQIHSSGAPFRLATEKPVTQTEDFKALADFIARNLPQFNVVRVGHLIQGRAWGQFKNGALYIYERAQNGTGYHEAFEGVWASYLTDQERAALAREFKSREGTFYNPFTKQTKNYKDASLYDVREMLAEEFINYVNDGVKPQQEKTRNIFQQLWDFIRELFGLEPKEQEALEGQINKVFRNISTGYYANFKPVREASDAAFREAETYRNKLSGLTQRQSINVLEGLTYHFFRSLYSHGNNINSILNALSGEESNELLRNTYTQAYNEVLETLDTFDPDIMEAVRADSASLYSLFKKNLSRYGIVFDELEDYDESKINDPLGIKDSISMDPRLRTSASVITMLASLPNIEFAGEGYRHVINELTLPSLVNLDRVHAILLNELSNIVEVVREDGTKKNVLDQMFEKLDEKFMGVDGVYRNGYAWIMGLKNRLRYSDDPVGLTKEDMQMRVAFTKSFSNLRFNPDKLVVNEGGKLYSINPLLNRNTQRIREEWANNLKQRVQDKRTRLVTVSPDGKLRFNKASQEWSDILTTVRSSDFSFYNPDNNLYPALLVLDAFGIEFSADPITLDTQEYDGSVTLGQAIKSATQWIVNLIDSGDIETVNDLFHSNIVDGQLDTLIAIEQDYNSEDNILNYYTADGEPQFAVGNPSLYGNVVNLLNSVESLQELVMSAPWLGKIVNGEVVLNDYQAGSFLLQPGGPLFNKNGRRNRKKVGYQVISGMAISDYDGVTTAKLQFPDRIAIKLHYLLNNTAFTVINSDKSTEFGIKLPGNLMVTAQDVQMLTPEDVEAGMASPIPDMYLRHLKDELVAAIEQYRNPVNIQYYKTEALNLGHFKDILGPELINLFKTEYLTQELDKNELAYMFIGINRGKLQAKVLEHIDRKTEETEKFLLDNDIFYRHENWTQKEIYFTNAIDNGLVNQALGLTKPQKSTAADKDDMVKDFYTPNDLRVLATMIAVNEELIAAEQHKLLYGHPAMYNDLAKRANGATSTKDAMVEDDYVIQWQDENHPRLDGKLRSRETIQTLKNISFGDVNVVSAYLNQVVQEKYKAFIDGGVSKSTAESLVGARFDDDGALTGYIKDVKGDYTGSAKAYIKMTEADAMAWGMPDLVRDLLFRSDKYDKKKETQWEWEVAYEKLVRAGLVDNYKKERYRPTDPQYRPINNPAEVEQLLRTYNNGKDPGFAWEMQKPQYFGYGKTEGIMHPVFLKHAVQPKFFRHVEGTQFEALYLAAQAGQVDIVGFESGQKVGNVESTGPSKFYSLYDEQGRVNLPRDDQGRYILPDRGALPQQELYFRYYGIQVQQSDKPKSTVVRGTQVTKIVMSNFYENGVAMSPEVERLISNYNDTLEELIRLGKESLLKELGLEKAGPNSYKVKDISGLIRTLRHEAEERDLPYNMIEAISYEILSTDEQRPSYPFDTLINREKIDNILQSIVDSRVISEKMPGKAAPQVASTLYEKNPRNFMYLKGGVYTQLTQSQISSLTNEERRSIRMMSNDLKFYRNENGKIKAMEAYVSWPFDDVNPEDLGLRLQNGVYRIPEGFTGMDRRLLEIIGFRIPTQAPNSIESIVIKGFLPKGNGDQIVVPSEIVGKAGSDFDIDKLNLYIPNYILQGLDYGTPEFRTFMVEDMVRRGARTEVAKLIMDNMSKEEWEVINRSAKSAYNRYKNDAPFDLEMLAEKNPQWTLAQYTFLKESLQNFNRMAKNTRKRLVYKEHDGTKEGLQNKYISILQNLVLHSSNYQQLVTPNSTATLKSLATRIKNAKVAAGTKMATDEKSPTFLRSFIGSVLTRERYLLAKRMVGISALHTTFHVMAQVSGLRLSRSYDMSRIKYLKFSEPPLIKNNRYDDNGYEFMDIKLEHHPKNQDGTYSIGHRVDKDKMNISDNFSEATSGFVDGAKDPFVFDLNLSLESAGTWFYLQHLGVPVEHVSFFFNQPVMDSYFAELGKNKSSFKKINGDNLYNEELFYKTISPWYKKVYGFDLWESFDYYKKNADGNRVAQRGLDDLKKTVMKNLKGFYDNVKTLDLPSLERAVVDGKDADPIQQMVVLMSYLRYQEQARQMSEFMQAISYDTARTKNIQENNYQVAKWNRSMRRGFIHNPENILQSTFIGEMKEQKEDVFNMFRDFFVTLSPELIPVMELLYDKLDDPDIFFSQDSAVELINRYNNHVLGYIIHTTPFVENGVKTSLSQQYQSLMMGENSIPKQLYKLKTEETDETITENLLIKALLPMINSDTLSTDAIKQFRHRLDTFEINNVIEAVEDLYAYAQSTANVPLQQFLRDLAKFSLVQNGFNTNYMDFKKLLSLNLYSDLVKDILENFQRDPQIDPEQVWKTFHQNNANNRAIVPKAAPWHRIENGILKINVKSPAVKNQFYLKYRVKPSSQTKKRMDRTKEDYEPILFQITDETYTNEFSGTTFAIYKPIPLLGNGNRMLEVYTAADENSIITDNNSGNSIEVTKQKDVGWMTQAEIQRRMDGIWSGTTPSGEVAKPERFRTSDGGWSIPEGKKPQSIQDVVDQARANVNPTVQLVKEKKLKQSEKCNTKKAKKGAKKPNTKGKKK